MTSAQPTPDQALLVLDPADDVAVAMRELRQGEVVGGPAGTLTVTTDVPAGHKVALHDLATGDHVHKYGQSI
ncbi:MAG TPA: UxaA family hydrolase, partial [Propionicimonas sp.]